jgi:site-specific recombinase XerC
VESTSVPKKYYFTKVWISHLYGGDAGDPECARHPDESGIRDRAMLHVGFAAGLRVSELTGLLLTAVALQPTPTLRVMGKGRKERSLPLWKRTASDIRAWLSLRGEALAPELFLNA